MQLVEKLNSGDANPGDIKFAAEILCRMDTLFKKNQLGLTPQWDDHGRYWECPCCFEFTENVPEMETIFANVSLNLVEHRNCKLYALYKIFGH
jgi:hypothetical protein